MTEEHSGKLGRTDKTWAKCRSAAHLVSTGSLVLLILLCSTLIILWFRSYSDSDWLVRCKGNHMFWVATVRGQLMGGHGRALTNLPDGWIHDTLSPATQLSALPPVAPEGIDLESLGLAFLTNPNSPGDWKAQAPLWLLCLLALLPVSLTLARRYWKRPRPAGTCVNCGYDLRATPERCPECGSRPHHGG
jgi:hypothetical protein